MCRAVVRVQGVKLVFHMDFFVSLVWVFCIDPLGVGLLMMVVFNLLRCCRDKAFDMCMNGIPLHWRMLTTGLERPILLPSIYRGHYVQKDIVTSRELIQI